MFNYLFVSTKWFSMDGGIQTINRELCKNLSKTNHITVCLSDEITEVEKRDALSNNVTLINIRELQDFLKEHDVDFVCTHASFTGRYIEIIQNIIQEIDIRMPKFIHFIHHDPEEIENYKEYIVDNQITRNLKKEVEVKYAASADCVVCIGRKLREEYKADILAVNRDLENKIKYINCGISDEITRPFLKTEAPEVLLSGRTSSLRVKGIDLFCRAVKNLRVESCNIRYSIRGEDGNLDELHKYLTSEFSAPKNINIKPYTVDAELLEKDKLKATLAVLPSREDGFGLAATEAISLCIPTIVSDTSGIGKLISELPIDKAIKERFVWKTGEDNSSIKKLKKQIRACLERQDTSYSFVYSLREALMQNSSWKGASKVFIKICQDLMNIELMEDEKEEISLFMKRQNPYLKLYDHAFEQASENIDILSIKLKKLREQQGYFLRNKAKYMDVRIALLDPCFPIPDEKKSIASIRESEEEMNQGSIRTEIVAWYQDVWVPYKKEYNSEWSGSLDIRLFKALPTVNMTRADDKMFIGTFLLNRNDISPTFIVEHKEDSSMGYKIFQAYLDHFEIIWENARSFNDISDDIESWKEK